MKPVRVEIDWVDAAMDVDYDGPTKDAGALATMTRIGYFVGRKKDSKTGHWYIVLVNEFNDSVDNAREPMGIPCDRVVGVTELLTGKKGDLKWLLARAKSKK